MTNNKTKTIAIIGGGPAGLMAAEVLSLKGYAVHVFDAMPTMARKFLRAGIGGLNITFDEPFELFIERYYERQQEVNYLLSQFTPDDLLNWVHNLGVETFVGSSGRVFPIEKKAAPLLRAWLQRLRASGVKLHNRHRWLNWNRGGSLKFMTPEGNKTFSADATLLAMGGASWPQLGSDGTWVKPLQDKGVEVEKLKSANSGFKVNWTDFFCEKFSGQPLKSVTASITKATGEVYKKQGDLMVSTSGLEGGLMYALSAFARDAIEQQGKAILYLDLCPNKSESQLTEKLSQSQGKNTLSKHLKNKIGLQGIKTALLYEQKDKTYFSDPAKLAHLIKQFPITLTATNPVAEAISTAGGVSFTALDENQMLVNVPGVFCAGEMLDWEAPTGGYLLSACFSSGYAAGQGIAKWFK